MNPSVGAAEYSDYISAEEKDFLNECPGYDIKQSDGEASSNAGALENVEYPFMAIALEVLSGSEWYHVIGSYLCVE